MRTRPVRYALRPQTFEDAILSCSSSARQRSRLLQGVSDLAPEAPIWSDQQLLIALAEFIRTTSTGFPPGMPPLAPSLHIPSNPLFYFTTLSAPGPRDKLSSLYFHLFLATAALRHLLVALVELVMVISFVDG